jgi:superfamily II RNA helicase
VRCVCASFCVYSDPASIARVADEQINTAHELILTELILENTLASFAPEEIVALLSIFVFEEKTDSQPVIPPKIAQGLETIYRLAEEVEQEQSFYQVTYDTFKEKFKPGLIEVVYEWARGVVSFGCGWLSLSSSLVSRMVGEQYEC